MRMTMVYKHTDINLYTRFLLILLRCSSKNDVSLRCVLCFSVLHIPLHLGVFLGPRSLSHCDDPYSLRQTNVLYHEAPLRGRRGTCSTMVCEPGCSESQCR